MSGDIGAPVPGTDLGGLATRTNGIIDQYAADLREAIERERTGRAEIEQAVKDSKDREARLTKAVAALEGIAAGPGRPKGTPTKSRDWQPSEESVQRVHRAFLAHYAERGEPVSMTQVRTWMKERDGGVSSETMRKAFEILRTREQVRPAGTVRGGGTIWAPMTNARGDSGAA